MEDSNGRSGRINPMWFRRGLVAGVVLVVAGAAGIQVLPTYPTRAAAGWVLGAGTFTAAVSLVGLALTATSRARKLYSRLLALAMVIGSTLILAYTILGIAIGAGMGGGLHLSGEGWFVLICWFALWLVIPTIGVRRYLRWERRNRQLRET